MSEIEEMDDYAQMSSIEEMDDYALVWLSAMEEAGLLELLKQLYHSWWAITN